MKTISVFGVFVADLCFISNAIPEKGQTILGSQHIIGPGGKGQIKQLQQLNSMGV